MNKPTLLSATLALLLVANATCVCAAMVAEPDAASHAHHQPLTQDAAASADCHSDCDDCEQAAGMGLGKDTSYPPSFKFEPDAVDWAAIEAAAYGLGSTPQATGPPFGPVTQPASTPVRRFDLQRK